MANEPAISFDEATPMVHVIRGKRVMLDSDLAKIYGVETRRLKEQFNRNRHRFPKDFAFQIDNKELAILRSQIAISSSHGGARYLPIVFTERGAIMLAAVLNSKRAVEMSVFVVRAFIRMREMMVENKQLAQKLAELEDRVGGHDESIAQLIEAIRELVQPAVSEKRREIGFHIKEQPVRYRTRNGK